jgi:hypothetical protein
VSLDSVHWGTSANDAASAQGFGGQPDADSRAQTGFLLVADGTPITTTERPRTPQALSPTLGGIPRVLPNGTGGARRVAAPHPRITPPECEQSIEIIKARRTRVWAGFETPGSDHHP